MKHVILADVRRDRLFADSIELDHRTRELLWEVIISLPEDADLVLDLRRLDFIDAGGLGVLIRSTKRVRSVPLCDVSPWVMRLLGLTGLDALLPVVSTSCNTPGSVPARRDGRAEQDTSAVGTC